MPPEEVTRTAGDLVAAWVDGYRERRGTAPLRSQVKRMASSAKRLAADLDGLTDPARGTPDSTSRAAPARTHTSTS